MTREAVERFKGEYGVDSPVFRARVEGEFPDQGVEDSVPSATPAVVTGMAPGRFTDRFGDAEIRHAA